MHRHYKWRRYIVVEPQRKWPTCKATLYVHKLHIRTYSTLSQKYANEAYAHFPLESINRITSITSAHKLVLMTLAGLILTVSSELCLSTKPTKHTKRSVFYSPNLNYLVFKPIQSEQMYARPILLTHISKKIWENFVTNDR